MPQNRIPRGKHGEIVVKQQPDGRWLARAQVRDVDGRVRSVRVLEQTKGAASRRLGERLAERTDPTATGIRPETTFEVLARVWLQHRRDHGKVRASGALTPQTLAIYDSEIQNVVLPAIGQVQIREASVPFLDRLFADVEHGRRHGAYPPRAAGRSTKQLRVVLGGMLGLAVSHGALLANPMRDTAKSARGRRHEVQYLTVELANHLRRRIRRESVRLEGKRMPNTDLEEFVDLLLGTGCREGEGLAIRPIDLIDVDGSTPMLHVCGTLVEPRKGYVAKLHRQDSTKTGEDRTLILPDAVAAMLRARMMRAPAASPEAPIFASRTGNWLSPSNMRTRLRTAVERAVAEGGDLDMRLTGTTLHTLRRTVGTLIAHEVSLDAAREQLGHRDPSITYQRYVGRRSVAPDVRGTLALLLSAEPASSSSPEGPVDAQRGHLAILLTKDALQPRPGSASQPGRNAIAGGMTLATPAIERP